MIKIDYDRVVAFGILIVAVLTLYFVMPRSQLDIFFDVEKDTSFFTVSNLGNKPITNVKVSYSLDCQELNFDSKYISKDVPILTESNGQQPFYNHYFDNLTQQILENHYQNKGICTDEMNKKMFVPFSRFVEKNPYETPGELNFSKERTYNFSKYYCDSCNLKIFVTSDSGDKEIIYNFINPIPVDIIIFCLDMPREYYCYQDFRHAGPGNIRAINEFFKLEYSTEGMYIEIQPSERK